MTSTDAVVAVLSDPMLRASGSNFDRSRIISASNSIGPKMKLLHWRRLEELGCIPDFRSGVADDALSGIIRLGTPRVEVFMVSHRWLRPSINASISHPDDEYSSKAKALVEFSNWRRAWVERRHGFLPEIFYWIDYCCVDQDNLLANMRMLPVWIA